MSSSLKRRVRWGLGIAALGLVALGLRAFWLEPASLRTSEHVVELSAWPEICDGLRVAVLADLHVGSPFNDLEKLEAIVARTQAAAPDLVLLAGDYVIQGVVGGTFVPPEAAARVLGRLQAPAGVYAVLGNHDWWLDPVRVRDALEAQSIPVLDDQARLIEAARCRFWLAGVSDLWKDATTSTQRYGRFPRMLRRFSLPTIPISFPMCPRGLP